MKTLWRHARLATLSGGPPWGLIERGALLTEADRIRWVGDEAALPAGLQPDAEQDLGGALLTPGLVDCHTHLVYGGQRARVRAAAAGRELRADRARRRRHPLDRGRDPCRR